MRARARHAVGALLVVSSIALAGCSRDPIREEYAAVWQRLVARKIDFGKSEREMRVSDDRSINSEDPSELSTFATLLYDPPLTGGNTATSSPSATR